MSGGIRLRHPSGRNILFLIETPRPLTVVELCGLCHVAHTHKTYHLWLDGNGEIVVSETVFERLREVDLKPLKEVGRVPDPDPLLIGFGTKETPLIVRREA